MEVAVTFELKTLSPDAVSRAVAKAERYRLLNEPAEAESICLDALQIDPENNEAKVTLLLALTDQFGEDLPSAVTEALQVVEQLRDPYEQAYYSGIIWERRAKAHLHRGSMGLGPQVYACLREAMAWYERAEAIRPPGNDDALLRWNACARLIMRDSRLVPPASEERGEPLFLE
jgi:tetratricopeptide (TPR) repeat protein